MPKNPYVHDKMGVLDDLIDLGITALERVSDGIEVVYF